MLVGGRREGIRPRGGFIRQLTRAMSSSSWGDVDADSEGLCAITPLVSFDRNSSQEKAEHLTPPGTNRSPGVVSIIRNDPAISAVRGRLDAAGERERGGG